MPLLDFKDGRLRAGRMSLRVVTELLYETAMNRRESRGQVCCTVIVASIAVIANFVGTS